MYQQITLPNGARILTEAVPGARSAALGFFVGVGSRHERRQDNGAAHFIEHMLFKAPPAAPPPSWPGIWTPSADRSTPIPPRSTPASMPAAWTGHLDYSLDLLSDMLFHSCFSQEDVETERGVILEEIGMYEDTPEDLVSERLSAAVYKGTALARPILGSQGHAGPHDGRISGPVAAGALPPRQSGGRSGGQLHPGPGGQAV